MVNFIDFYYNFLMIKVVGVLLLSFLCSGIPLQDQRALANSLQVGRKQDPNQWNCADCTDQNRPLISYLIESKPHNVVSIVSVYEDTAILAFRYTATLLNVWEDLLFTFQVRDQHTCEKCKVQKEYNFMWEQIKLDVINDLAKIPAKKLIITGISLGGGLAAISFVDIFHSEIFNNVRVVTFGAPRVGNKEWAEWFDEHADCRRYFIREDPIAFLPKCLTPICEYVSIGTPIRCDPEARSCTILPKDMPINFNPVGMVRNVWKIATSYDFNSDDDDQLGSLRDHVLGYKLLYNYTVVIPNL